MTRQEKEELLERFSSFILEDHEGMQTAIRLFLEWDEEPASQDAGFRERNRKFSLLNIEEE